MIYEPDEDSYLLADVVKRYAKGNTLDIGTGSGIQAETAAKKSSVKKVLAIDINKDAVKKCKEKIINKKITFKQSDLFSNVKNSFDTIICNPPYLPQDPGIKDIALYGGKKGWEMINQLFADINDHLNSDGQILLLFSSTTDKKKVEDIITKALFDFKQVSHKHIFYEDLYVYRITRSKYLQLLHKMNLKNVQFFMQGKRGMIYTCSKGKKKIVMKIKRPESKAFGRIRNEGKWLAFVNKMGIGPKMIFKNDDMVLYIFAEGEFILNYCKTASKKQIKDVLREVFKQCYKFDQAGVDKEEMHHPMKHVIIDNKGKITQLDFERMRYTKVPKNVTQFCMFLTLGKSASVLKQKGLSYDREEIIQLSKAYKKSKSKKDFDAILNLL